MSLHSSSEKLKYAVSVAAELSDFGSGIQPQVRRAAQFANESGVRTLQRDSVFWAWAAPTKAISAPPSQGRDCGGAYWCWAGR